MNLTTLCLVVIALSQLGMMIGLVVAVSRLRQAMGRAEETMARVREVVEHGTPVLDEVRQAAAHVKEMVAQVRDMTQDVRGVEQRVAAATSKVVDQIEPPIRTVAAMLAGVRAGVGRWMETSGRDGYHTVTRNDGTT